MSEQGLAEPASEARLPSRSLVARLARHRPDGATLVTLASLLAFAIITAG